MLLDGKTLDVRNAEEARNRLGCAGSGEMAAELAGLRLLLLAVQGEISTLQTAGNSLQAIAASLGTRVAQLEQAVSLSENVRLAGNGIWLRDRVTGEWREARVDEGALGTS